MSRRIRFTSLRRAVLWRSSPELRYRVHQFLFLWLIIILILLGLTIFSLVIFIYMVPCPVWSAGRLPPMVITFEQNGTTVTNASLIQYNANNNASLPLPPLPPLPSDFSSGWAYDFYMWKCPLQAVYFINEVNLYPDDTNNNTDVSQQAKGINQTRGNVTYPNR